MTFRSAIPDFELANPLYVGAVISFWTVDVNGVKTGTLANLYAGPTGATQLANPQVLDAEGKFRFPVYHNVPVIAEVVSDSADTVQTGIILPYAIWGGNWTAATLIQGNVLLRDPLNLSIYIATNTYVTGGSIANDVAAGNLVLVFQGESATIATNAANAAVAAAGAAAASAATVADVFAGAAKIVTAGTTTSGVIIPSGTTGQRPTPAAGVIAVRFNTTTGEPEMYAGSWGALVRSLNEIGDVDLTTPPAVGEGLVWNGTAFVAGPAGGGMFRGNNGTVGSRSGDILRVNAQTLTADVTIAGTENASATGPLAVNTGVTLTVSSGGTLVIL